MQLTETQLQTIETYLLSWELQFRDFYDEMFDHFCTEIEQRMSNGTSFDYAMEETSYLFRGHEFGSDWTVKYYGLKAYEMEWVSKFRKKNNKLVISGLKNQVLSFRIVAWALICLGLIEISLFFGMPKLWIILLFIPLAGLVVSYSVIYHRRGFKISHLFTMKDPNRGIHGSRESLLSADFVFVQQLGYILIGCSLILTCFPNFLYDNSRAGISIGSGITTILSMIVYAFYLVAKRKAGQAKKVVS